MSQFESWDFMYVRIVGRITSWSMYDLVCWQILTFSGFGNW